MYIRIMQAIQIRYRLQVKHTTSMQLQKLYPLHLEWRFHNICSFNIFLFRRFIWGVSQVARLYGVCLEPPCCCSDSFDLQYSVVLHH
jgi:hypothetical protein